MHRAVVYLHLAHAQARPGKLVLVFDAHINNSRGFATLSRRMRARPVHRPWQMMTVTTIKAPAARRRELVRRRRRCAYTLLSFCLSKLTSLYLCTESERARNRARRETRVEADRQGLCARETVVRVDW